MGCGDLEPEMSDTRTVILKMDLRQNYSLRGSLVSAAELDDYKTHLIDDYETHLINDFETHLIIVLPSWQTLSREYQDYYSIYARELMDESKQVTLEIPLYETDGTRTEMKIFAFLFKEAYDEDELFSEIKDVSYYGKSPIFEINEQTDYLSLTVTLIDVSGTDNDTTTPQLVEDTAVSFPTDYTRIHL